MGRNAALASNPAADMGSAHGTTQVIVAVGPGPVAAATAEAPNNPHTHFVVVAGNTTGRNVTTLNPPPDQMSTTVSNAIIHQVHAD